MPRQRSAGITHRLAGAHAHDDGRIFLDLANLAELDIVAEPGHQRWLQTGAAQITGAETRKEEKQRATDNHGSQSYAERGKDQRAIEAAFLFRLDINFRRDRALRSAPHFEPYESGDAKQEKKKKETEESRIDGENGGSENGRETRAWSGKARRGPCLRCRAG